MSPAKKETGPEVSDTLCSPNQKVVEREKEEVHSKEPKLFMKHPLRLSARHCSRYRRPDTDRAQGLPWWEWQAETQVTLVVKTR